MVGYTKCGKYCNKNMIGKLHANFGAPFSYGKWSKYSVRLTMIDKHEKHTKTD